MLWDEADTSQTLLGQQNNYFFAFMLTWKSVFTHHEYMIYDLCVTLASGSFDETAGVEKPHNKFRIHRRWCDMTLLLPIRGAERGLGCRCVAVLFGGVVVKCDKSLRRCAGLLQ